MIDAPLEDIAREIRIIYQSDPSHSEPIVEQYLERRLKGMAPAERLTFLEGLVRQFKGPRSEGAPGPSPRALGLESEEFSRLFSLLMGKRISKVDLSSRDLPEKLAHSLNTIFDTLNQIIGVINATLMGKKGELETIRQIIGSNLESEARSESLQNYLDQIQEAFLISHRAFKQAGEIKVMEILTELNPDRIASMSRGGLRFGALRKAELFEVYKERYQACKGYFESGRLMEDLLREFEKSCQQIYKTETRRAQ